MRPVTPFMAIRTVLRVTSVPSVGAVRPYKQYSKRFLSSEKLASDRGSGQGLVHFELFEGANKRGRWPYGLLGTARNRGRQWPVCEDVRQDARPEDDEMTVTLADVAARAQVSPATVSRVLNGNYPVATSTRERVLRAVDELDYVLNGHASALAAATSDL